MTAAGLAELLLSRQPAPPTWTVVATAVAAGAVVLSPATWPVARHVVTVTHEGAHGVAALLTGRRLVGIRLHSDTSGLTVSRGPATGPGMVLTLAAGYVGPGLAGLGAAAVLAAGRPLAVLVAVLVLLAALLVQVRNWFGLGVVLLCAGGVLAALRLLPDAAQVAAAYLLTWFLLLAAPRPVIEMQAQRRRRRASQSDADQLARLTGVPALVWVAVFLGVDVLALLAGAALITGDG